VAGKTLTQPYWLAAPRGGDLFSVGSGTISDDERERDAWLSVPVILPGLPSAVQVRAPVVYHFADPVRGDVQRPVVTVPVISVTLANDVALARANAVFERPVEVMVQSALVRPCTAHVALRLPPGMRADSAMRTVVLAPNVPQTVLFLTRGKLAVGAHTISAEVTCDSMSYTSGYTPIEYDHITPERMYRQAVTTVQSVEVAIPQTLSVGYVDGVGDNIEPALRQLGISVTAVDPAMLPFLDLSKYNTIVVGPRAYQANRKLIENSAYLLEYVRRGGNLVVQYGQFEMQQPGIMPYPITLSRPAVRVTEENTPVTITDPNATLLTTPNRITQADFAGWVQERATYMPSTADSHYQTMLEMHDTDEPPNTFALLTTTYGRGRYTYVPLALFRQIPAGVPGGVRLFANFLTPHLTR
jgi:hypothetical protein